MRAAPILCLLLAPACAHQRAETEVELGRLRGEVERLEQELRRASARIEELDRKISRTAATVAPPAASRTSRASSPPVDGPRPALPVVKLTPEAPEGVDPSDVDVGALDDGRPPILIQLGPSGAPEKLPVDRSVLRGPDPVLDAAGAKDPKDDYDVALTALRERNDPALARTLFAAFESRHPHHTLTDNAVYWQGEASFALGEHPEAIACFERLERNFPRSDKIPYASVRWGRSLVELSNLSLARARWRMVVEQHPNSPAADEARSLLAATAKGSM
jgi:TolA-binding protein